MQAMLNSFQGLVELVVEFDVESAVFESTAIFRIFFENKRETLSHESRVHLENSSFFFSSLSPS